MNLSTAPVVSAADPVSLLTELERAVQHVLAMRLAELRVAATDRTSVESRWLQGDLYRQLSNRPDLKVQAQAAVATGGESRLIDIVLNRGDDRLLVALKTFMTNYGRPGKKRHTVTRRDPG